MGRAREGAAAVGGVGRGLRGAGEPGAKRIGPHEEREASDRAAGARRKALVAEEAAAARAALGARLGVLAEQQARWGAEVAGRAPRGHSQGFPFGHRPGFDEGREGGAWKKNELDLLRRTLLSLGLGHTETLLEAMRSQMKGFKRGRTDVRDAVHAFLEALCPHADVKDVPFLKQKLHECRAEGNLRGFPVRRPEGLPESSLPSAWHRIPALGSGWTKRLRVLDHVADAIFLCTHEETQGQARAAIASIPDMTRPASWWGFEQDVAILKGVAQCGYGNYEAVRFAPDFAQHFAGSTGTARPREHKALGKGTAHGKGCRCVVCRQGQIVAEWVAEPGDGPTDAREPADASLGGSALVKEEPCQDGETTKKEEQPLQPPVGKGVEREEEMAAAEATRLSCRSRAPKGAESPGDGKGEGEQRKAGCSKCRWLSSGCRACNQEKAARPRDGGYDPPVTERGEHESTLWPLSDVLTRRIKRIADNLSKLKKRINAREMFRLREAHRAQDWTKRERIDLLKALMQWGLPRESTSPDAQPNWDVLRELSGLERKSNQSMLKGYQGLMLEADRVIADEAERIAALPKKAHAPDCRCIVCLQKKKKPEEDEKEAGEDDDAEPGEAGDEKGAGGDKDAGTEAEAATVPAGKLPRDSKKGARVDGGVLSPLMARHLKERILLIDSLQQAFASPWSWEISYGLQDLPSWWVGGEHDKKLAEGLLLHGVSAYWEALKEDPQFGFTEFQQKQGSLPTEIGHPGKGNVEMEDAGEIVEPGANEASPGLGDFPPMKVCMKRLKQLTSGYRKFCKSKRAKLRLRREAKEKAKRQKLEADATDAGADEGTMPEPSRAEQTGTAAAHPEEERPSDPLSPTDNVPAAKEAVAGARIGESNA